MPEIVLLLLLGAAVGVASMTVARSTMFQPLREWAEAKSFVLGKLLTCSYCVSHWLALAGVVLYLDQLPIRGVLDLAVVWLAVVAVATVVAGWIYRTYG